MVCLFPGSGEQDKDLHLGEPAGQVATSSTCTTLTLVTFSAYTLLINTCNDAPNSATVLTTRLIFLSNLALRLAMVLGSEAREPGTGVGGLIVGGLVTGEKARIGEEGIAGLSKLV